MQTDSLHRLAAFALILLVTIARLAYLAFFSPFDLSPDEAHYWDWSRQLDWCYYSKGPLVAWLIRLNCTAFGDTMFAVRLPAVVCGALLLLGLHDLTMQVYRSINLALAVVALALTLPVIAVGSSLMTIDAPFAAAWMGALVFAYRASVRGQGWAWPLAGGCILIGLLAKHTMVLFVPSFMLFLLMTPALRRQLRQPGFWIMAGLGSLGGAPILIWNVCNDWVTFRHTQSHAGFDDEHRFGWFGPLSYVGGQFALLLGFWFIVWVRGMWTHRPWIDERSESRFLWWMSIPTFVFFGLFALKNHGGEPNWPLAGYLSGMVLAAGWLREQMAHPAAWWRTWSRVSTMCIAGLGLIVTLALHQPIVMQPILLSLSSPATEQQPMPMRRLDPTLRLRGWRHLAAEVDRACAELRARGIEPIVATERWTQAGELGFYCDDQPKVYCMGLLLGDRDSQYDLWRPNPVRDRVVFRGRTFLLVGVDVERLAAHFASTETARPVQYREAGQLVAEWSIAIAHDYRPE